MDINRSGALYQFESFSVAPNPPMELLAKWYFEALEDGTLAAFYYENTPGLEVFMQTCRKPGTVVLGGFATIYGKPKMVSLGCVNEVLPMGAGFHKVEIGMACLRQHQQRFITIPLAKMMMAWVFEQTKADFAFGSTPEPNRAMLRFLKVLGMRHMREPIPHCTTFGGKVCGTYVSYLSKAEWLALQSEQGTILSVDHEFRNGEVTIDAAEPCVPTGGNRDDPEYGGPE